VKRSTLPRRAPRVSRDLVAVRFLVFEQRIELPAQGVGELDDDALRDLEGKAVAAFDAIRGKDDPTDEDVAEAERLAEVVTAVRTELGSRTEAVDSRRNRLAALGGEIDAGPVEDEPTVEDETDEGDEGEGEPALVASSSGDRARGGAHTDPREIGRVRAQDVSGRSARPLPPAARPVSLVAAADVLGPTRSGQEFSDMVAVAEAVGRRAGEYPTGEPEPRAGAGADAPRHRHDPQGLPGRAGRPVGHR
jgi:hypothetical protein